MPFKKDDRVIIKSPNTRKNGHHAVVRKGPYFTDHYLVMTDEGSLWELTESELEKE